MRIGIFNYRQFPFISANTAIGYTIGETIKKQYNYDVEFIGYKQSIEQEKIQNYQGIPISFFNCQVDEEQHNLSKLRNRLKNLLGEEYFLGKEAKRLKKIIITKKIDVLICVIAPITTALIAYAAKLDIPILLYQLDPFYNVGDIENSKLKKKFIKILPAFEKVYTTDLLYEGYAYDQVISKYKKKIKVLQFPKIIEDAMKEGGGRNKKIRLLYGGTLYRKIRDPKILLELSNKLSEEFEIVYLGKCDVLEDQQLLENSNIVCKGYCSQEELKKEIMETDILINIGNKVKNQLGSKLIEYIATGKPILNIYQFQGCPTLKVLENYSYKFNIAVSNLYEDVKMISEMNKFLYKAKGKKEEFSKIQELYSEYTPEYVTKCLIDDIEKIKSKGR